MEETAPKTESLKELRNKKSAKPSWLRRKCPWLFRWNSTFYYAVFLFLLGILWAAYPMFTNGYTQLLNWDYTWQYIPFTYDYWDTWHLFFTTGHFRLYDAGVFMGTDMIGSGSYYGLFDPFMFICYLFPRSWIPQMYAQMTYAKIMFGGLMMRCYLKNLGIKEWTARIGGLIYAFSGFTTFFEGSPNFTSAMAFLPLILWGVEKVIHERKPTRLILGVTGLGLSCFFYMPIICIFGAIYSLWRYFSTIKTRSAADNGKVIALGVGGFAMGILLSSFSLLPSFRETMLSGRSSSIGTAYLQTIIDALKARDFRTFFALMFEEVGDNPGREMMGLTSFFFPAGGWMRLPLASSDSYDAWTASMFCFTPCVILIFSALINSIRLKKWSHLLIFVLCVFATFTNFCYFFFYGFSGNGYGRWYLVLIPLIVYYCCWAFDLRKDEPRFIPFAASLLALLGTIFAYVFVNHILEGKVFQGYLYNIHNTTYWSSTYHPQKDTSVEWIFFYQLAWVVVEGTLFCIAHRRKWLQYALFGLVAVEAVVMGNLSYAFCGTWSWEYSFAGGVNNVSNSLVMTNKINSEDKSFFRTYSDTYGGNYAHNVFGTHNVQAFHSLMNFDVETFALNNQMKFPGSTKTTYGGKEFYNPGWSGGYNNKRYSTDTLLGMRYYLIENNYAAWKDVEGKSIFLPANVPFGTVEKEDYSPNRDYYRVYQRSADSLPNLGYAVDSDLIYRMGMLEGSQYKNQFFGYYNGWYSFLELERLEHVQLHGAIIDDDVALPDELPVKEVAPKVTSDAELFEQTGLRRRYVGSTDLAMDYYETASDVYDDNGNLLVEGDKLFAASTKPYYHEGLGYFLNHSESSRFNLTSAFMAQRDTGKIVVRARDGGYLNEEAEGCYIEFRFCNSGTSDVRPRVYALGMDQQGNENQTLVFDNKLLTGAHNYQSESCTFGLYVPGRAKQIVFCFGGKGSVSVNPANFYCTITERSKINGLEANLRENALKDVKTDTNVFRFRTRFDKPRVVVTQLGYDKGWGVEATLPNGQKQKCQMLRLNGGLVGFVAPCALDENNAPVDVTYVMRYETPLLNVGVALWVVGVCLYSSFLAGSFILERKRRKKEFSLDA